MAYSLIIKICGITRIQDAQVAIQEGVDWLGIIFYQFSKRYRSVEQARNLVEGCIPFNRWVGVFVNESVETIVEVANELNLWAVQLHGNESVEMVKILSKKGFKVLKSIPLDEQATRRCEIFSRFCDYLLLDTPSPKYGGTGQTGNWEIAKELARSYPVILAGGINPDNVRDAIQQIRPRGIDVSSGVEFSPGEKDCRLIHQLIQTVRKVEQEE